MLPPLGRNFRDILWNDQNDAAYRNTIKVIESSLAERLTDDLWDDLDVKIYYGLVISLLNSIREE